MPLVYLLKREFSSIFKSEAISLPDWEVQVASTPPTPTGLQFKFMAAGSRGQLPQCPLNGTMAIVSYSYSWNQFQSSSLNGPIKAVSFLTSLSSNDESHGFIWNLLCDYLERQVKTCRSIYALWGELWPVRKRRQERKGSSFPPSH